MSRSSTDRHLAKQVILEIVRQAGGRFRNATNLYKAFYYAHLYYAKDQVGLLTEWPIVRMPRGPGIDDGDVLISELKSAGVLRTKKVPVGPHVAEEYLLTDENLPGDPLPEEAVEAIKEAVKFVKNRSARLVSDTVHEFSRSWKKCSNGEPLDIYIDLLSDAEYDEGHRKALYWRTIAARSAR